VNKEIKEGTKIFLQIHAHEFLSKLKKNIKTQGNRNKNLTNINIKNEGKILPCNPGVSPPISPVIITFPFFNS
jgi:hypothetical protein